MSTDADKDTACPNVSDNQVSFGCTETVAPNSGDSCNVDSCELKKKPERKVCFPSEDQLVTQYFEPANPWQDVPTTSRCQLAAEYLESCRHHRTSPVESVLQQIRELPENAIGGGNRVGRLTLSECTLLGAAAADALEAVLKKTQFRRLEIDHAQIDDDGAEALFDMIEYYESATAVCINGPRHFGIRGWQAASRMIRKSAELCELEVCDGALEASHAPVVARALKPHSCRLRTLTLQRVELSGEPLLCLVIALKSNSSVRELRLGDNRLTSADATQLASLLRFNTTIQLLDLSNNQIQDAGVGQIVDALAEQAAQTPPSAAASPLSPLSPHSPHLPLIGVETRGLAFLVLWNNQLTRNCAVHLSKALRTSSSLCVLNIGRNALGSETVRSLQAGGALVSLGLQAARLGADAARALADLIRADTRLQRLDLRDNKLGAAGLQLISSAMKENVRLTQIDLDDQTDSCITLSEDGEAATVARLTREIRALCRRNEPTASSPERRVHRKISLTCHTACVPKVHVVAEEERRGGRLRSPAPSPAPSPAGSPVPHTHTHSRFSVTRVTPERETVVESPGTSAPLRPTYSPTVSRFKVVQIMEPPKIQVHSVTAEQPQRKSISRFSVTRNYDSMYNPTLTPSPPHVSTLVPSPSCKQTDVKRPSDLSSSDMIEEPLISVPMVDIQKTDNDVISDSSIHHENDVKSDVCVRNKVSNDINNCNEIVNNYSKITDIESPIEVRNKEMLSEDIEIENAHNCLESNNDMLSDSEKIKNVQINPYCIDSCRQISHNETVSSVDNENILESETKMSKSVKEVSEKEVVDVKLEVTVKRESVQSNIDMKLPAKVHFDQNVSIENEFPINSVVLDKNLINNSEKNHRAMNQIVAITEDLGNLIQEMKDLSLKTVVLTRKPDLKVKNDSTQTDVINVNSKLNTFNNVPANFIRDNIVLKKNKSETSLDSPDLEVSRLMNKKMVDSPFCDSSSSLEISGSSMESLNALDNHNPSQIVSNPIIIQESIDSDMELDRRKPDQAALSTESSIESNTSETVPVNSGNFLNMSVSSNESVSPIIFGGTKIHGSLSSLEASVSSLDSTKLEKVMMTSADSGIEHSMQNIPEKYDPLRKFDSIDSTLTNPLSLKETVRKADSFHVQETLTTSPKRASSLLDVPALKTKGLERIRKISWVAPSSSFHIPKAEPEPIKLTTHLEKLLSLFQHPTSIFSRSASQSDEEKKSASNTPPRKDSSLTSSFWSWGNTIEKNDKDDKNEDRDSPSEATDSTLSERIQVSFVDESLSKKFDSKTPSMDTDNTLSEFQSFPLQGNSETSDIFVEAETKAEEVTELSTDDNLVQNTLDLSLRSIDNASSNGNKNVPGACDNIDLLKPNDLNKNMYNTPTGDNNSNSKLFNISGITQCTEINSVDIKLDDIKTVEPVRPRSFAAVLKASGTENSLDKQICPEAGQSVDKLPSKVIRGIKENISPENTLTSSMTNTKALAGELNEKQVKNQPIVNVMWEVSSPLVKENINNKILYNVNNQLAPIATVENCDEVIDNAIKLDFIDDDKITDERHSAAYSETTFLDNAPVKGKKNNLNDIEMDSVDLGKDAFCYLMFENKQFTAEKHDFGGVIVAPEGSLARELKEAELKEQLLDLSPELVVDEVMGPVVFAAKEMRGLKTSSVIPERAKLKKSNSLEDLSQKTEKQTECSQNKIILDISDMPSTSPRDIPERRNKARTRSGSSPKSLPESLNKPGSLTKMESILLKKKKKVTSLGKIAKDSLLALNMSEEEIAEFRRSYKLTSVESLRSLESVSEDANSQSGNSADSRCRSCFRTSQESLMSLDSITEDCRCVHDCDGSSTR